jgi:hypothetical protein
MKAIKSITLPPFSEAILFALLYAVIGFRVTPLLRKVYADTGHAITGLAAFVFGIQPWLLALAGAALGSWAYLARRRQAFGHAHRLPLLVTSLASGIILIGLFLPSLG